MRPQVRVLQGVQALTNEVIIILVIAVGRLQVLSPCFAEPDGNTSALHPQ